MIYLDQIPLIDKQVADGALGMFGSRGYENQPITVRRQHYAHAFGTHPPARVRFHLDRRFAGFSCQVAINDDVPAGRSHADFAVVADGREVAVETYVRAGEAPRPLTADISGAEHLELVVRTSRWDFCHAVWLDPQVYESPVTVTKITDALNRAEFIVPPRLPRARKCVATVVSQGFEHMLDDM